MPTDHPPPNDESLFARLDRENAKFSGISGGRYSKPLGYDRWPLWQKVVLGLVIGGLALGYVLLRIAGG